MNEDERQKKAAINFKNWVIKNVGTEAYNEMMKFEEQYWQHYNKMYGKDGRIINYYRRRGGK